MLTQDRVALRGKITVDAGTKFENIPTWPMTYYSNWPLSGRFHAQTFPPRNFSGARLFIFLNKGRFSTLSSQLAWVFRKMGCEFGKFRARGVKDVRYFWRGRSFYREHERTYEHFIQQEWRGNLSRISLCCNCQSHANIHRLYIIVMQDLLTPRLTPHVLVRRWETHLACETAFWRHFQSVRLAGFAG